MRPKNWREENSNIKERDIDQWCHRQTLFTLSLTTRHFNRLLSIISCASKDSFKISIHMVNVLLSLYFIENQLLSQKVFLKSWHELHDPLEHRSIIRSAWLCTLPASGSGLIILLVLPKSLTVPCSNDQFFIFLAFHYFVAEIKHKIHRKTGSHSLSKTYSAMLKWVDSKKCTLSMRHHYEAVPKIHIDASIWIFGIFMWRECQRQFYFVNLRRYVINE